MTRRRLLISLFSLFSVLGVWSADGDVYELSTTDGYTLRCYVMSEEEKTMQLGAYQLGLANAIVKKPYNSYNASLTIPEYFWLGGNKYTVKAIGSSAFQEEYWLSKVNIPETVTDIGSDAFYRCTHLQEVNIPKGVKSINRFTFYYTNLNSIVIPEGVDSIGRGAFMGTNLDSIAIPASVRYIFSTDRSVDGGNSFESILGTNWIAVEEGNTIYDSRDNCNAIIEKATNKLVKGCCNTTIPDGINIIGKRVFDYAFYSQDRKNDYSWQNFGVGKYSIDLPRSVVEIGESAFYECNELGKIVIPGKVRTIGNRAFYGCSGMDTIVSYIREPFAIDSLNFCYWSNGKSKELSYSPTLYVPIGTSEKYKNTEGWNTIENIVEIELKEPPTCATPTIAFEQGELVFSCETDGAQFVSEVKVADAKKSYDSRVALAPTYEITVYATAPGYDDSDVATATITWRNGKPVMEGFSSITLEDGDPKGDVNEDGTVDVADIATIISIMAGGDNNGDTSHAPVGVEAIDLGLPSGTLWANMNVGAERPEEGGLFFAWGEIMGYSSDFSEGRTFNWANYKWMSKGQSNGNYINKYQIDDNWEGGCWYDSNGLFVGDGKANLDLADDAAHVNWGGKWVMPTYEELCELLDNTTNEWTTLNGVSGRKFTSKTNGNSIFMPAAGLLKDKIHYKVYGHYWTASVYSSSSIFGWELMFTGDILSKKMYTNRFEGQNVRPVIRK